MPKQTARKTGFKQNLLFLIASLGAISLLFLTSFNIHSYISPSRDKKSDVLGEKTDLETEKEFWENFLENNSNYLPGIIELARIEFGLGNKSEANKLLNKAKSIDPDFEINLNEVIKDF